MNRTLHVVLLKNNSLYISTAHLFYGLGNTSDIIGLRRSRALLNLSMVMAAQASGFPVCVLTHTHALGEAPWSSALLLQSVQPLDPADEHSAQNALHSAHASAVPKKWVEHAQLLSPCFVALVLQLVQAVGPASLHLRQVISHLVQLSAFPKKWESHKHEESP